MNNQEPILRIKNLTKYFNVSNSWFGKPVLLHAVEDMSFDILKGHTVGIVGESGSGKSTLARLILKLIPATSGEILYDGMDLLKTRDDSVLRRDLQMIFQDPYASLDPRIKIGDSIAEPLREHKMCKSRKELNDRVVEMLERVGLQAETAQRFPHEFSGGQRQRINIARALVTRPKIILCDEAVSALDVSVQAQVLNLFNELKRDFDLTYLFISHDLSVVKFVSDVIIVMYLGEMMEMAPAEKLFKNPLHPYTRALISAIPNTNPTVKKQRILLNGDIPSAINPPEGCRFLSRCPHATSACRAKVPLRDIGEGKVPDLAGKRVVVIGGGNVAMDATRTSLRLGAAHVTCVYRRRVEDMTALLEEVDEAKAEGGEILPLHAPDHIEADENGDVVALWAQPQLIGKVGRDGRPAPQKANTPPVRIPCDYVIVAIGQAIHSKPFEEGGIGTRWGAIQAESSSFVPGSGNVFAGGDAVSGPATVIRAVAAGKVAADNIDSFLGYHHTITVDVEVPAPQLTNTPACGRVNLRGRPIEEIAGDFDLVTEGMTEEECQQECSRCLRCDHFGYGVFKGGRNIKW